MALKSGNYDQLMPVEKKKEIKEHEALVERHKSKK